MRSTQFSYLDQSVNLCSNVLDLIVSFVDAIVPVVEAEHVVGLAFFLPLKQRQLVPRLHEFCDGLDVVFSFLDSLLQVVDHVTRLVDIFPSGCQTEITEGFMQSKGKMLRDVCYWTHSRWSS